MNALLHILLTCTAVFNFYIFLNRCAIYGNYRILLSVDAHLHLSETFGIVAREQGVLMVELVLYIVWQLVDASLEDEGLIELTPEKKSRWLNKPQDMEIDGEDTYKGKKTEFPEKSWKSNTVMSIEVVAMLLQHKLISGLLCLARQNMYDLLFAHCLIYIFCNIVLEQATWSGQGST